MPSESSESTTEVMIKSSAINRGGPRQGNGRCERSPKWILLVSMLVMCVGVSCLLAAILLRGYLGNNLCPEPLSAGRVDLPNIDRCEYSEEARRIDLDSFLYLVYSNFYQLYTEQIYELGKEDFVKKHYRPVNLSHEAIKYKTDIALQMLEELNNVTINYDALTLREQKVVLGVKHFLRSIFGNPFSSNYYAGDFLMGPNIFCWLPFCRLWMHFEYALPYLLPHNLTDLEHLVVLMSMHRETTLQYMTNIKEGIQRGMVRSREQCEAGLNSMERHFFYASANETEILNQNFVRRLLSAEFVELLTPEMHAKWKKDYGKTVNETLRDATVEYFGKPMVKLLRFLRDEQLPHCVSSDIASGLHDLPLNYVYYNDTPLVDQPTNHTLPSGHVLNGTLAYEMILQYFTTTDISPEEISEMGYRKLNEFYPQAVQIAKDYVGEGYTEEEAIKKFREKLYSQEMYYNKKPFPTNESDSHAHKRCSTPNNARRYCPERWHAMEEWVKAAQEVMSLLTPKLLKLFYFVGDKKTTPACPVELSLELNPSSSYHAYMEGKADCQKSAEYFLPFFLGNMGPTYSEWTLNAHETRPGHHLEVQGAKENFEDECDGLIYWLSSQNFYTAYTEGWATYAEYPLIGADTDLYDDHVFNRYGMIKWQIIAALRMVIDTGIHYNGMTRKGALEMFDKYAWDNTDFATKEVTRYQSAPGQSVAYMVGQSAILELRNYTKTQLGDKFDLKEFHYQVLCRKQSPLGFLERYIHKYVDCELHRAPLELCQEILSPMRGTAMKKKKNIMPEFSLREIPLPSNTAGTRTRRHIT